MPGDLVSPNNPFLDRPDSVDPAQQPRPRGHGHQRNGRYLYPTLEGATRADLTADPTAA